MSTTSGREAATSAVRLVCPDTGLGLRLVPLTVAETAIGTSLAPRQLSPNTRGELPEPVGATCDVLLREDLAAAYPVVEGIPVLLVPEMLTPSNSLRTYDLTRAPYAEAYEELGVYDAVARSEADDITASASFASLQPLMAAAGAVRAKFPEPRQLTVDATYDGAAQWDALVAVGAPRGRDVLQVGGKGLHAVKNLLGGAGEAWLLTPVVGEALCARALAEVAGVADRLNLVVGVAEQMPFPAESFDSAYSGGCLHHTETSSAFREAAKILRPGGCFAAVDPWRAPGYTIGTRVLGKREVDVYCRPLDATRIVSLSAAFGKHAVVHHGALTRYLLLAIDKTSMKISPATVWRVIAIDDRLSTFLGLRRFGSSVAVLGWK